MMLQVPGMRALLATLVAGYAGYSLLMPVSPLWAAQGGADEFGVGMVTTVLMLTTIATQLAVSTLLRAFGWSWVLALGMIFLGVPAGFQALSSELWAVLLTTALRGIGFGIITVCGATAISFLAPAAARGKALGIYGLAVAVPQLVFMPAAPALTESLGIPPILIAGAMPLIGLLWARQAGSAVTAAIDTDRSANTQAHGGAEGPWQVLQRILVPVATLVVVTAAGGAIMTFGPQITIDTSLSVAVLFALTGMSTLMRWYCGVLSDRLDTHQLMWPLLAAGALGLLCIVLAIVPGFESVVMHWLLMLIGAFFVAIAYGGLQTVTLARAFANAGYQNRHYASVSWNVSFDVGTAAGSALVGAIALSFTFSTAFFALGAFAAAWTIFIASTARRASSE